MPVQVLAQKPLDHTTEFEIGSENPSILGLPASIGSVARDRVNGIFWFKFGPADTDWGPSSANQEQESFIRFGHNGVDGDYSYVGVGSNSNKQISFAFPLAMSTLIEIDLLFTANETSTGKTININSSYGMAGENKLTHQQSASLTNLSFTANNHMLLDLSSVFTNAQGGDIAGINLNHQNIGQTLNYLGLRIRYKANGG